MVLSMDSLQLAEGQQRGSAAKCNQKTVPSPVKTQHFSVYIGIPRVRKVLCFFPFDRILFMLHWHSLL